MLTDKQLIPGCINLSRTSDSNKMKYIKPRLTDFGSITAQTATGSGTKTEKTQDSPKPKEKP